MRNEQEIRLAILSAIVGARKGHTPVEFNVATVWGYVQGWFSGRFNSGTRVKVTRDEVLNVLRDFSGMELIQQVRGKTDRPIYILI